MGPQFSFSTERFTHETSSHFNEMIWLRKAQEAPLNHNSTQQDCSSIHPSVHPGSVFCNQVDESSTWTLNKNVDQTNEIMRFWIRWRTCCITAHVHYDIQYIVHITALFFFLTVGRRSLFMELAVSDMQLFQQSKRKAAETFSFLHSLVPIHMFLCWFFSLLSCTQKFRRRVQESTQVLRELEISLRTNHIGWVIKTVSLCVCVCLFIF